MSGWVIVQCDGHEAVYKDGKRVVHHGDAARWVIEAELGVSVVTLNDDAHEGDFPDVLPDAWQPVVPQ
jgi:hypothetical protein